jgi:hypothetical protein
MKGVKNSKLRTYEDEDEKLGYFVYSNDFSNSSQEFSV